MERAELGLSEGHGPSCFRPRASKSKAPLPSRPCRSTGSEQTGAPFIFVLIRGLPVRPGGNSPPAKCRAGTVRTSKGRIFRPAPTQQPSAASCW